MQVLALGSAGGGERSLHHPGFMGAPDSHHDVQEPLLARLPSEPRSLGQSEWQRRGAAGLIQHLQMNQGLLSARRAEPGHTPRGCVDMG